MRLAHRHPSAPPRDAGRSAQHRARASIRGERGVALVEFAIVVTVLITLVFGTLDLGYQWRYAHEAAGASRTGARFGARLGNEQYADLQILTTVRTALQSSGTRANLSRVIVYRANADGRPPSSCLNETSPSGACNVYPRAVVGYAGDLDESEFGANGCMISGATHSGWCPTSRVTTQVGGDTIGVMVVLDRPSITGMFPTGEAKRHTAMKLEPH